jgi:hypothetical protein
MQTMTAPGSKVAKRGDVEVFEQTYKDPQEVLAEKLSQPADLTHALEVYDRNRKALMKFIGNHLEEASYEEKNGKQLPKAGEMRDFYAIPGATTKALTKLGAEKLGQLFRFARGDTQVTHQVCTKELCEVRVKVTLVDQYRREAGSFESACSSQERSFQAAKGKYDGDFRAALNDVVARASKRAFVQAMIYSTATDEVFQAGAEPEEQRAESETTTTASETAPRLPAKKFGKWAGARIADVPTPDLEKIYKFCTKDAKNPKTWEPIAQAVADELDGRRVDETDDDLPF